MRFITLFTAILLTWSSGDPTLLVQIDRRREDRPTFRQLVIVSGTQYLDKGLRRHTSYCYRARYATGTVYTPQACATTN